jgi:hypothetical protein
MTDAGDDGDERPPPGSDDPASGAEGDGNADAGGNGGDESDSWRFDLDEVSEEGVVQSRIEAGDPEPEHVLFVVLGALATALVFARLWLLI